MAILQGQESPVGGNAGDEELIEIEPEAVPAGDDDDDDDDSVPEQAPEGGKRLRPSKARRVGNYKELADRAERLERELSEQRTASARMQGMFEQDLRTRQQTGKHPLEEAVDRAFEEQEAHYNYFVSNAKNMTAEDQQKAQRRARELEERKADAQFNLRAARSGMARAPSPEQQQQQAFQMQLNARYPDLVGHRAGQAGMLILQQKLLSGKPNTWETYDEAADEARAQYNLPGANRKPKPTGVEQARYAGIPKGAGAGAGNTIAPTKITKKQAEMAERMYPSMDPGKARQKWWNEIGKKSQQGG